MNEEIMNNEEMVVEVVEDTANGVLNGGLKAAIGITLVAAIGFGAYKLGKKIHGKLKSKKEAIEVNPADDRESLMDENIVYED